MLQIRTLGASEITIRDARIGPEQTTAFVCVFLVAMYGPAAMSRRALAELLWPLATEVDQNHRLRSLLHRLRRVGVPLVTTGSTIALVDAVVDFREFATPPRSLDAVRAGVTRVRAVLPDLHTPANSSLADRIDDARDVIVATIVQWLTGALRLARSVGDWQLVEQLSRAARDVDGASEDAWLSLAEAQCLTSGRGVALQTLDEYVSRFGTSDERAALPALLLRRRIAEATAPDVNVLDGGGPPLIGRDGVLRRVWSAVSRAREGRGGAILLWGPAAIGKTRVLEEIERVRMIESACVIRQAARPVHALRPLSLVADLVSRLLREPGAVGCEPGAYATLRRFAGSPPPNDDATPRDTSDSGVLFDAFVELLAALTDEAPLVISIDDGHLVDPSIWRFWRAVFRWSNDNRLLWLVGYRALREAELASLPEPSVLQRLPLRCLNRDAAAQLYAAHAGSSAADFESSFTQVGGHPAFLRELARHGALSPSSEPVIDDWIARLSPKLLHALGIIATLGGSATPRGLADLAYVGRSELGATLGELAHLGLIREEDGVLRAFSVWCDAAVADESGGRLSVIGDW